jgi:hypothetical protein
VVPRGVEASRHHGGSQHEETTHDWRRFHTRSLPQATEDSVTGSSQPPLPRRPAPAPSRAAAGTRSRSRYRARAA